MTSALLALAALALGETGYPRWRDDLTGAWREPSFRVVEQGDLGAADVAALRRRLDRVSEVMARAPALASLGSYEVKRYQGVFARAREKGRPTGAPDRADVQFLTFRYGQQCSTCPPKPQEEATHIVRVTFNSPSYLPRAGIGRDAQGEIHSEPPVLRHVAGFPVLQRSVMVIQRDPSRPLYVPVSQERWIRAELADQGKARAADARRGRVNEHVERRIAALQAELDGLSPAERAAPAYQAKNQARRASGLADPGNVGRALVGYNPDLFDPALPRTALQLAIVTTSPMEPPRGSLSEALLQGVDWQAVQAAMREP